MSKRNEFSAWFKKSVGKLPMPTNQRMALQKRYNLLNEERLIIEDRLNFDDRRQLIEHGARAVWNALKTKGGK